MPANIDGDVSSDLRAKIDSAPASNVVWIARDRIVPNDYNPNRVAPPELDLLVVSILEDGFTQPVVILPDYTLVDGFHRWTVSGDPRIRERYGGFVPAVIVNMDPIHRKMSTVRHNRARGSHGILPMAAMVRGMLTDGVSESDLMRGLGMEPEEVERLNDKAGMPERMAKRGAVAFGREKVPTRDA